MKISKKISKLFVLAMLLFSCGAFPKAYAAPEQGLSEGLVAYLKLDGNLGDSSNASRNGAGLGASGVNATPQPSTEIPVLRFSNSASYDFDGTDDYVSLGDVLGFERTDAFSVSLWFKRRTVGTTQILISKQLQGGANRGWRTLFNAPNTLSFALFNNNGANRLVMNTSESFSSTSDWYHVLTTYDGSSSPNGVRMYVNGASKEITASTNGLSATILSAAPTTISGRENGSLPFDGWIDDVRIYNRVLSEREAHFLAAGYDEIRSPELKSPQFDQGKGVLGKVFWDANENGTQDEGEKGIEGVKVASDTGIYAITDEDGKYHFPYIETGQRLLKVDDKNAVFTTGNPRKITVTEGVLSKVSFGVKSAGSGDGVLNSQIAAGNELSTPSPEARPLLKVSTSQDPLNLAKNLSISHVFKDPHTLEFTIESNYRLFIQSAELILYDRNQNILKTIALPQPLPYKYTLSLSQHSVEPLSLGTYQLKVYDHEQNADTTAMGTW